MRKLVISLVAIAFIFSGATAQTPKSWRKLKEDVNFLWASDLGRNGCYDQQVIANLMGEVAKKIKPECLISTGDTHHGSGVKSVNDPRWKTNFENIYSKLDVDWYAILGNHEYRGNSQALIDYSKVNPRWNMPSRYYTKVFKKGGVSVRLVMLDTTPMIERFRTSETYLDAGLQNYTEQLEWLDKVLSEAKEDWVLVMGHHPIHAYTKKPKSERTDMRNNVDKILRQHNNVAMYLCGHIHSFQHLRDKKSDIDYVITSSAAQSRDVKTTKRTIYCSPEAGFSVITASKKQLSVHMIDRNGNLLNTVKRSR